MKKPQRKLSRITFLKRRNSSTTLPGQPRMIKRQAMQKANAGWLLSESLLMAINVPLSLFLIMLLTSCASTSTNYVQVPSVPIPSSLLADCEVPPIPEPLTWGESLELNERLLSVLEQSNRDKAAIRKIERERQK